MDKIGQYGPYIGAAILLLVFVPVMFLGFAVAASIASIAGGGSSSADTTVAGGGTCQVSKDQAYQYLDSHGDQPPKILIPVYQGAAAKFGLGPKGASILAGINKEESDFGRSTLTGVRSSQNSAGAAGPMQFGNGTGAAGDAWSTYGMDGNGDGKKDIYDPADAIFAAAKYMKAGGAPGDWQAAIFTYNHADWYVSEVLGFADQFNLPPGGPC